MTLPCLIEQAFDWARPGPGRGLVGFQCRVASCGLGCPKKAIIAFLHDPVPHPYAKYRSSHNK